MTKEIPLTQGKVALVDDADYEWLNQWKWCYIGAGSGYAVRHKQGDNKGLVYMHRAILEAPRGIQVDHINHDTLDNQRSNLRFATNQQNAYNRIKMPNSKSQYRGVTRRPNNPKWLAICAGKYLGSFVSEANAAKAYDEAARIYYGEYAHLNFPNEQEQAA